ncbi:peptidoglycan recognition protein 4-like [Haliotis cracherodii]|uniref:peptidoglycan recognition protein 4-like n=1 Tax=Haliotis cracherodii TaxID=6455 RepID=UPI0039EB59FA
MLFKVISVALVTSTLGFTPPASRCACASVDTAIERNYTETADDSYGTLSSPRCLPYRGAQRALNDGRIYAHVSYHGMSAWLLTFDIYIKKCNEPFECVCANAQIHIRTTYGSRGAPVTTLTSGQCVTLQGKSFNSSGRIWVQVKVNNKTGWLKTGNLSFHKNCRGHMTDGISNTRMAGCPTTVPRAAWEAGAPHPPSAGQNKPPHDPSSQHGPEAGDGDKCMGRKHRYQDDHKDGDETIDSSCVNAGVTESHGESRVPLAALQEGAMYDGSDGILTPAQRGSQIDLVQDNFLPLTEENISGVFVPTSPTILARAVWGARPAGPGVDRLKETPQYVIIHHGASAGCSYSQDCVRLMQCYQNFHVDGRGWSDIGYNFAIGDDGNVYEGRGWGAVGAHTYGYNRISVGIAFIGNFNDREPSQAALDALLTLLTHGVRYGELTPSYTLLGRRDVGYPTESPGDRLYKIIRGWKHYNNTVIYV